MTNVKEGTGYALVGAAYTGMGILSLIIHIWTIVIAYITSGLLGGIITLVFPVVAQIFWFIKIWSATGTVMNAYCLAILGFIACWVIMFIGMALVSDSS
jgi:hypothetical protein